MAEEVKVKQGKSTKVKETLRVIKYALCAGSAGIIETLSFTLLNETMNWPYWPAYLIALVLSVLWNFTLNRKFTYRSANNALICSWKALAMALNFITEYLYQRFYVFRATIDTNDVAERAGEKQLSEAERKALEKE